MTVVTHSLEPCLHNRSCRSWTRGECLGGDSNFLQLSLALMLLLSIILSHHFPFSSRKTVARFDETSRAAAVYLIWKQMAVAFTTTAAKYASTVTPQDKDMSCKVPQQEWLSAPCLHLQWSITNQHITPVCDYYTQLGALVSLFILIEITTCLVFFWSKWLCTWLVWDS